MRSSIATLRKKSRRGFKGYPVATVAYYGPSDQLATKIAVGIVHEEGAEPNPFQRWTSADVDIRSDLRIQDAVLQFITTHGVKSVVVTDGIIGCPHEEGIDYPEGGVCPQCPFWACRDRFAPKTIQSQEGRMSETSINLVAQILNEWNPLGERAQTVTDLNGYRTEAIDIISVTGLKVRGHTVETAVMTVLNQAFDLSLSPAECKEPARRISDILQHANKSMH